MTENEKIIKMVYEDGLFPLSYADKIKKRTYENRCIKNPGCKPYATRRGPK